MAAPNISPIYSRVAQINWGSVAAANAALDGTGTVVTVFTADATNGGRVEKVRILHLGTNIATVLRLFINDGLGTTAVHNSLYAEITVPANTISQVAASVPQEIALPLVLPPGYKLNVTVGTTIAAGVQVSAPGGAY